MAVKARNTLLFIAILAGVAIAGFLLWQRIVASAEPPQEEVQITPKVTLISVADFQDGMSGIRSLGEVEALEQVELKSQMTATVNAIHAELGDSVEKGHLLVELDHSMIDAQLAQASAAINRMQSSVDLRVAGASDEEIAQALAAVEAAKAAVEQAETQREQIITSSNAAVASAELALSNARSSTSNSATANDQSLANAYEQAVDVSRSSVEAAEMALATITDYQYLYFYGNNEISADIARKKETMVKTLLGASDAGRWNNLSLAGLDGGVKGEVDTLYNDSNRSDAAVEQVLPKVQLALDQTLATIDALRGAMDSYLAVDATPAEKSAVDGARASVAGALTGLMNVEQVISSGKLMLDSSADSNRFAISQAEQNLENAKSAAESNIASANSMVDIQKASFNSAQAAYDRITADPRAVDLSGLQASVSEAQASYRQIETSRDKAFIKAPFSGVISSIPVKTGELVGAGQTTVSIINDIGLQVKAFVNEKDRKYIAVGAEVAISGGVSGAVTHIAPSIDAATKKIEVLIAVTSEDALLTIGEFVEVEIRISEQLKDENFVLLPFQAVKSVGEKSYVFTVEDGAVVEHEVELGRIIGENVRVVAGIEPDWQIVSSTRAVRAGEAVEIAE